MEWKDKVSAFKQIDVRGIQGNFFQGLKKQAIPGALPLYWHAPWRSSRSHPA